MEHRDNPALATVAPMSGVTRDVDARVFVHAAGSALRDRTDDMPAHRGADLTGWSTSEDGSLVTEYGLLAIVAATLAGAVMSWASNGALVTLFNALLRQARALVGA